MTQINYQVINELATLVHNNNVEAGWWTDPFTKQDLRGCDEFGRPLRDTLNLLMLIVTEIAEAAEGVRKNLMDDKLPHRSMLEVELADAIIRALDLAGARGLDLGGAIEEKLNFNKTRPDHQLANRLKADGKKC